MKAQATKESSANEAVSENATKAAQFAALETQRYQIGMDKSEKPLKLLSPPVLRWSNPTDGEVNGSVVFWTKNGSPEAAASIYQFFDRMQINVELVSLSEVPLKAVRNQRLRWSPEAGVKFMPIRVSDAPARTRENRQLQIRALAAPPWDKIRGPNGAYVILEWSSPEAAATD